MSKIILQNRYEYYEDKLLGKGGFGHVYHGFDKKKKINVAIKIDNIKYNEKEYNIYKKINDKKYMATAYNYFICTDKSYLVMESYSKNADCIKQLTNFNEKDIIMLGIQIIQQLNYLHKVNFIHRDIKPENFVYDIETNKFKLIDFGLCKNYTVNNEHIKFSKNSTRCGTVRYMSINSHNRYTLSRRDDLISLAYSLIYIYQQSLPWQGMKIKKSDTHNKIKNIKIDFSGDLDDLDIPSPIIFLYKYSTKLTFSKKPDYSFIITCFYDYLKSKGNNYDGMWSFKQIIQHYNN